MVDYIILRVNISKSKLNDTNKNKHRVISRILFKQDKLNFELCT